MHTHLKLTATVLWMMMVLVVLVEAAGGGGLYNLIWI